MSENYAIKLINRVLRRRRAPEINLIYFSQSNLSSVQRFYLTKYIHVLKIHHSSSNLASIQLFHPIDTLELQKHSENTMI